MQIKKSMYLCLAAATTFVTVANAASTNQPFDFSPKEVVTPIRTPSPPPPPPLPPPPPPPVDTTPPVTHVPVIPTPPPGPFSPPIVVSTDVTKTSNLTGLIPPNAPPVSDGIMVLADKQFPREPENGKDHDSILVRARENTIMERPGDCSVKLLEGSILVSVRRPSKLGFIKTPLGDIALSADGELLVTVNKGTMHVLNASARGAGCKIKLGSQFAGKKNTFAIQPGYDFTAGEHRLSRNELRPADGMARRRFQVFEDGRIALSEFSVTALLKDCDLVASLQQKDSGNKERRILADLSKMAAVLNQVNGTMGYSYAGTGVASKDAKPAI